MNSSSGSRSRKPCAAAAPALSSAAANAIAARRHVSRPIFTGTVALPHSLARDRPPAGLLFCNYLQANPRRSSPAGRDPQFIKPSRNELFPLGNSVALGPHRGAPHAPLHFWLAKIVIRLH